MSAEHYWAKLAPASAKLSRGSSGHDRVTAADVAGATQGLHEGPLLAGMVYLSGDDAQRSRLARALQEQTGCQPVMAEAAMFEMDGGELCRKCNGKGYLAPQVVCDRCLGRRRVRPTAARLASMIGVSRATWYRHAHRDYEDVFGTLDAWVAEAGRHVASRLRQNQ